MSDPKPYESPPSNAEPQVFRARASIRRLMVAMAWLIVLLAIGMAAFAAYSLIRYDAPARSMLAWFSVLELIVALALVAAATYWGKYWTEYRVVVGEQFVSREGLPHLVDRRKRIAFDDVLRVTHGTRNILKIIPKEGDPLAVGLKSLEGEPTALIRALRERLPANRFEANLEVSIFQGSPADRLGYIIGGGSILLGLVSFGGLLLREPVLERTAWLKVPGLADDLRIGLIDTADDGSIWMVTSESPGAGGDEISLVHVAPDGSIQTVGTSTASVMREALEDAINAGRAPIDSLAIDSRNRPWLIVRGDPGAFFWDGAAWTRVPARLDDLEFEITDLARAGEYMWARAPEHNALFRVDTGSLETLGMGPLSWEAYGEMVEIRPFQLTGSAENSAVLFGEYSFGRRGYMTLTTEGSIGFTTELLGAPDLDTWEARFARPDGRGQIHVLFSSPEVCVEGRRLIKMGTRLANANWVWRDLVYPASCLSDPRSDEIQVDVQGRVWIRPDEGNVIVFPSPDGGIDGSENDPIAVYSHDNSGFNEGKLVVGSDGSLLGVNGWRTALVRLDAGGERLPTPLPSWFAWYLEYPFVAQMAVLFLLLPFMIALGRRNFRR